MQILKVSDVQNVTCLGAGPIGAGWAAYFLAQGYKVTSYIHSPDEETSLRNLIDDAWVGLTDMGLAEGASLDNLTVTSDLAAAVKDTQFVQESVPESLPLKQALYKQLSELVSTDVVISSSTSGLRMTDIQAECPTAGRTVVGHPFNPPYLLPLVEVVGGEQTADETVTWVADFYRAAGKAPLVLQREVPGFVATRLQEAIWREALHMIAEGEATVEDIDFAVVNGPGPRWAMMGPCLTYHVGGGEGGMEYCLEQFGPAFKLPWSRMEAPELTPELARKLIDGSAKLAQGRSYSTLNQQRDKGLVAIQKTVKDVFK
jgi:carnitine 3-dehydrogenase